MFVLNVLLTFVGIGLLIFVHEAGHYICARLAGVRVYVFSLGFGPRLFGFVKNGTDYRVSLVPVGGYVQVAGQEPFDNGRKPPPDSLMAKSTGQRLLFYAGGVIMNLLFAFIAFPIAFRVGVEFPAPVLGSVELGSPAWEAGLLPGDRILAVGDREPIRDLSIVQETIALNGDDPVRLRVERDDKQFEVSVKPRYDASLGFYTMGQTGLAIVDEPLTVGSVTPGSPAAEAGLSKDDVLVALNGETLTGADMRRAVEALSSRVGQSIALTVRDPAGGNEREISFLPETEKGRPVIGIVLAACTVRGIRPGSPIVEGLGLKRGDRILGVDGTPFGGTNDELSAAATDGKISLYVQRVDDTMLLESTFAPAAVESLFDHLALGTDTDHIVVQPRAGQPAELAGMLAGDRILTVNGIATDTWTDLVTAVKKQADQPLAVSVARGDETAEISVTPTMPKTVALGFIPRAEELRQRFRVASIGTALSEGFGASIDLVRRVYLQLRKLFTGEVSAKNLGGIVTISVVGHHFASDGIIQLLYFLGLLSINLAVLNFLPIPILDGGHAMFILIEKIKGSPISEQVFSYSQLVGLAFVVALLVFVTYNDVMRLL